jgi:hypothetical protein
MARVRLVILCGTVFAYLGAGLADATRFVATGEAAVSVTQSGDRPAKSRSKPSQRGQKAVQPPLKPFQGIWSSSTRAGTFDLLLIQTGNTIKGYHCSVTRGGRRIDCADQITNGKSGKKRAPTIRGKFKGRSGTVSFVSAFNQAAGGAARIQVQGRTLRWTVTRSRGTHYLPSRATLVFESRSRASWP